MDWMGLEKISRDFDLLWIKTHPILSNPHGLERKRTSPYVIENGFVGVDVVRLEVIPYFNSLLFPETLSPFHHCLRFQFQSPAAIH
jgi:hypothetical protein